MKIHDKNEDIVLNFLEHLNLMKWIRQTRDLDFTIAVFKRWYSQSVSLNIRFNKIKKSTLLSIS